jgi:AcrR family transcriptional regulator
MITRDKIVKQVAKLFAAGGVDEVSMRSLAKEVDVVPSVLYYYFPTKVALLQAMYEESNRILGEKRAKLPFPETAKEMLRQRIEFQLDNAELIMSVLKFYLAFREKFPKLDIGYLPDKTYLHIKEVLQYGVATGEFANEEIDDQSRVMVHAINGYLMEYFPHMPTGNDRERVVNELHTFLYRSIIKPKSN